MGNFPEEISPFRDHQVKEAITYILKELPALQSELNLFWPGLYEFLIEKLNKVNSIRDFQLKISYPLIKGLLENNMDRLFFEGKENLGSQPVLFLANHRDIILDSALLNVALHDNGYETTYNAIGDNLVSNELLGAMYKLNKSFIVKRSAKGRQAYSAMMDLSRLIRKLLIEEKSSVWLAQSEGRSKNGIDTTQSGVLKMLGMCKSDSESRKAYFKQFTCLPCTISYEWDPCAAFKAREMIIRSRGHVYEKEKGEDLKSILQSVKGKKGRIHICLGKALSGKFRELNGNLAWSAGIAKLLDREIRKGFKLWGAHYVAADMLEGGNKYSAYYTGEDRKAFDEYCEEQLNLVSNQKEVIRRGIIEMYASSLYSKLEVVNEKPAGF